MTSAFPPSTRVPKGKAWDCSPKTNAKLRFAFVFGVLILLVQIQWKLRPASAHAELLAADPAPGAVLARSPPEIRLTFSEALRAGSTFVIFGEGFAQVPGFSPEIDSESPEQLVAAIPVLAPGAYTLQWVAVTGDGHEVSGSYSFRVEGQADKRGGLVLLWGLAAGILLAVLVLYRSARRR